MGFTPMSIREAMNNSKWIALSVAVIFFTAAGVIAAYSMWPTQPSVHGAQGFYTDDGGKTYFRDSLYKFSPFDHDGKTAYGAMVYAYGKGEFVAYEFRFTPAAKSRLEAAYAKGKAEGNLSSVARLLAEPDISLGGCEIKMRGTDQWIPRAVSPHPHVAAPDGGDCVVVNP
jgi:hypothetical protein